MIAVDTSSFIAYLSGEKGKDVDALELAFQQKQAVFPPPVLCELLSDSRLPKSVVSLIKDVPLLPIIEGFWERAGFLRSKLISKGRKARLADTLVAQTCIDHGISLITRDLDFRCFAKEAGLSRCQKIK